jgi:1-acyl-sn-glycerol-3-phosphate acyltransferase
MLLLVPFKIGFRIIIYFLFSKLFLFFFIAYCILAYFVVKHIMAKTRKYREFKKEDEEMHEKYKMFRRLDGKNWDEKKFLIGAILFSWIKLSGVFFSVIFCFIAMKIVLYGKNIEDFKDKKMRKKIELIASIAGYIFYLSLGIIVTTKEIDYDYTKYLGEGYKEKTKNVIPAAYISNHTSWLDIVVFIGKISPGFISRIEVKSYPCIGYVATALGCLFVDRNNKDNRGNIFNIVNEKMNNIYSGEDTSKLLIFPEGTTTNTTGIIPFRKGAFASKLPLKPFVLTFDPINKLSLAMDVVEMLYHLFLVVCQPLHTAEVISLPVFVPNEYYFNRPESEGKEQWIYYAETMRDIMCDASGLKKIEGSYEMKREYLDLLRQPKQKSD